jgi:hypothetical protein
LGSTHLALTPRDLRRPRYLMPTDDALIPALEATGVAVMAPAAGPSRCGAPGSAPTSHGLGLLVFALLLLAVAVHDSVLVSDIPGIRPLLLPRERARLFRRPADAPSGR